MKKALYPGTFDPVTLGHLDVIERSAKLYDEVIVAILENVSKSTLFTKEERKVMIEKEVAHLPNVKVVIGHGLTVHFAKEMGCSVMIRGIRATSDYEYEVSIATANMMLDKNIETIFLLSQPQYSSVASSIVKEIARFRGDVSSFVTENVQKQLKEKLS